MLLQPGNPRLGSRKPDAISWPVFLSEREGEDIDSINQLLHGHACLQVRAAEHYGPDGILRRFGSHVVESLRQVRVTNHADPVLVHPREVEHSLRIENAALSVCMRT